MSMIPGFMPQPPERATRRLQAAPDGSLSVVIYRQPAEAPEPQLGITVIDSGRRVVLSDDSGAHVFKTVEGTQSVYRVSLTARDRLPVGTCFLYVFLGAQRLATYSFSVDAPFIVPDVATESEPPTLREATQILALLQASKSGEQEIQEGAETVRVHGLDLSRSPRRIFITIARPSTADRLAADVLIDTVSKDGFTVALSSPAPAAGFILNWRVELL